MKEQASNFELSTIIAELFRVESALTAGQIEVAELLIHSVEQMIVATRGARSDYILDKLVTCYEGILYLKRLQNIN